MLNEVKDIHDELYMISQVFEQQLQVLLQMSDILTYRPQETEDIQTPMEAEHSQRSVFPHVIKQWNKIQNKIEQRRDQLIEMDANALRTFKNINNLFDMKQRQANVLEAHYSRKVAQDSARQSTTIMIFTVVTIIFLPLSFMSSFYALNVKEFPRDDRNELYMSLGYVSGHVFGIGLSIAFAIVILAFGINAAFNRFGAPAILGTRSGPSSSTTTLRSDPSSQTLASPRESASTGASHRSLANLTRRTTTFRTSDGRPFALKTKRVVAERQDGVSLFSYNSLVRPSNGTAMEKGGGVIESYKDEESGSSPSARSWWSTPWRSSPVLATQPLDQEVGLERTPASWDVGVQGERSRRWVSWSALMAGRQSNGRVSTI
jgi:CorA-like Mg2+ transporter protein